MNHDKLLELAALLDTVDEQHVLKDEPRYRQSAFVHPCGTPACALGHWAAAHPDTWDFRPMWSGYGGRNVMDRMGLKSLTRKSQYKFVPFESATQEFELTGDQTEELFEYRGCGGARTAAGAATYIRAFVERDRTVVSDE